jgi:UDP-2,3-diacylglucosamine pyrophosphatase LpxH
MSDIHIGSPLFELEEGLTELLKNGYDKIYFLGDVVDSWEMKPSKIEENYRDLINLINSLGNKAVMVLGNHDPKLNRAKAMFPDLEIHDKNHTISLDGKVAFLLHGHKYDMLMPVYHWLRACLFGPLKAVGLRNWADKIRSAYYRVKYKIFTFNIISNLERWTVKRYQDDYDVVIMGHTHEPKIVHAPFCTYVNCGCMCYKPTFVEYDTDTKKFELVRL